MDRLVWLALLAVVVSSTGAAERHVGDFRTLQHKVAGKVYFVDDDTIRVENFKYDGKGPDAYFYVGRDGSPIEGGVMVPYPEGADEEKILGRFDGEDIVIKLNNGWKTSELRWLSVWCRRFVVNFGDVFFEKKSGSSEGSKVEFPKSEDKEEGTSNAAAGSSSPSTSGDDDDDDSGAQTAGAAAAWSVLASSALLLASKYLFC